MQLSYRQLEATLAAYLNVHPDRIGTFRARMKQLQRLEFPIGVNIGRGVRMTYTASHLLQLAAAFEIMGAGLAAKTATNLVNEFWDRFEAAFGRSHSRLSYGKDFATFVCFASKGPVDNSKASYNAATVHDLTSLTEQVLCFPRPDAAGRAAVLVVRADYLFERINRLAGDVGQASNPKWASEYRTWKEGRDQNQELWDYSDGGAQIPF